MGQAVSRRSLAAEAGFNIRPGHVTFLVYNMAVRQNFLKLRRFCHQYYSTMFHTNSFIRPSITSDIQSSKPTESLNNMLKN